MEGTDMLGKAKCKILKEIRQKIADENDIPYVTRECTYQGDCSGTCPKCESELRYLERELEARQRLGKAVAVTALCAGVTASVSACGPTEIISPPDELGGATTEEISGDVPDAGIDNNNDPDVELEGEPIDPDSYIELDGDVEVDPNYDPDIAGNEVWNPDYDPNQELGGSVEVDPDYYELEGGAPYIAPSKKTEIPAKTISEENITSDESKKE